MKLLAIQGFGTVLCVLIAVDVVYPRSWFASDSSDSDSDSDSDESWEDKSRYQNNRRGNWDSHHDNNHGQEWHVPSYGNDNPGRMWPDEPIAESSPGPESTVPPEESPVPAECFPESLPQEPALILGSTSQDLTCVSGQQIQIESANTGPSVDYPQCESFDAFDNADVAACNGQPSCPVTAPSAESLCSAEGAVYYMVINYTCTQPCESEPPADEEA